LALANLPFADLPVEVKKIKKNTKMQKQNQTTDIVWWWSPSANDFVLAARRPKASQLSIQNKNVSSE
jgi:hypothetical protein